MRGDLLGEWLPAALADLLCVILKIGGVSRDRDEILSSWGFRLPARQRAAETDRALAQLFSDP